MSGDQRGDSSAEASDPGAEALRQELAHNVVEPSDLPPGYQLALNVRGRDYEVDGTDLAVPNSPYPMKGVGPFLHIDRDDRPDTLFARRNTLHFAPGQQPYLLLPIIP